MIIRSQLNDDLFVLISNITVAVILTMDALAGARGGCGVRLSRGPPGPADERLLYNYNIMIIKYHRCYLEVGAAPAARRFVAQQPRRSWFGTAIREADLIACFQLTPARPSARDAVGSLVSEWGFIAGFPAVSLFLAFAQPQQH